MVEINPPTHALKVLILEDQESDALLMVRELRKAGRLVEWKCVEREADFIRELDAGDYDLVLSDYRLPAFNAREALLLFRERKLDIPFIVITGSLGEEQTVEMMKLGASDFLIKDRMSRLDGAVSTALEQKRLRDDNRQAVKRLRDSEERFRLLAENAPDIIYRFRILPELGFDYLSPAIERLLGYPAEAFYNDFRLIYDVVFENDLTARMEGFELKDLIERPKIVRLKPKDGSILWTELRSMAVMDEQGKLVAIEGIARDISERVHRDQERDALIAVAASLRHVMTRDEVYPAVLENTAEMLKGDRSALVICGDCFDQLSDSPADGHAEVQTRAALTASAPGMRPAGLLVEGAFGGWSALRGTPFEMSAALYQQLMVSGLPFFTRDTVNAVHGLSSAWAAGLAWLACVPVRAQGRVLGLLWVGSQPVTGQPGRPEESINMLTAVADIIASALNRAGLYEETQRRVQHLTALRTIDRAITASLDLRLMMNVLVDQLISQKNVDGVQLLLVEPYTHQLSYAQGRGFHGRGFEGSRLRMGESLAGKVVLERRILNLPDLNEVTQPWSQKQTLLAEGFRSYLGVPLIAKGEVLGVLELLRRTVQPFDQDWLEFVEALTGQVAIAINNAEQFERMQRSTTDIIQGYDETIEGWARAQVVREGEKSEQINRAVRLTILLARRMGLPDAELVHLRRGVLLHDIGKMALPDSILLKQGPLSDDEREQMRKHPVYAFEWLSPIAYLRAALDIPYCHHEAWDGSGYPRGLKGAQIPLAARIFAMVDVWDALCADRPFRAAWPKDQALKYIQNMAGVQFDPQVVAVFVPLISTEGLAEDDF